MTAFASSEAEISSLTINCELRSVNHRYCDISFKLPERLRFLEASLRSLITAKIKRGKFECNLSYKKNLQEGQAFNLNMQAVTALLEATAKVEALMPNAKSFSALEVLAFQGIQQEQETDKKALQEGIKILLDEALQKMLKVRAREGEQLKALLEERCLSMELHVASARQRMPLVLKQIRVKISERLNTLVAQPDFDRLEQEMVLLAQKLDVAEELERLDVHIIEVQRVLKLNEPVGRRLDFLMQEMNREANTLGSKSADKEMTSISIELKVLIEQMREQIQNIE